MRPSGIITLTTDFGSLDSYVAAMKGVILGINPHAEIVDVSHEVRPQQVEQGAFLLASVLPYFPPGTVHIAVVDPGVGTDRHALALVSLDAVLVGPDNGILSVAIPDDYRSEDRETVDLPIGYRAIRLSNESFFHRPVSSTFHGRDIFAPVAAHLSLGADVSRLGDEVQSIKSLRPLRATPAADGSMRGRIIHIDRFGNLVTDIRAEDLSRNPTIEIAGYSIDKVSRTYHDADGMLALVGSSGYLEIAVRDGNAAAALNADIGTPVTLRGV